MPVPAASAPALEHFNQRRILWAPPPPPESDLNPSSGECVQGVCKNGVGKWVWGSGDVYEGQWDGQVRPHGKGRYVWYDGGDSYDGDWVHGLKEGRGVYTYANGAQYDGQWRNDVQWGENNKYSNSYGDEVMIDIPEGFPPGSSS